MRKHSLPRWCDDHRLRGFVVAEELLAIAPLCLERSVRCLSSGMSVSLVLYRISGPMTYLPRMCLMTALTL